MGRAVGKVLKIAGVVVGVAALAVATGGSGLVLAAGAGLSFTVPASTLFLVSAGLSAAGSLLSQKPKAPTASSATVERLTVSIEPRAPRTIALGLTALATDIRDQEYSDDQTYLHRFVVVASHKINDVIAIFFDDKIAWSQTGGVASDFAGYLDVQVITEGSAANAINIGPRMGSSRRYTGLAYVYLRYRLKGLTKDEESPFASTIASRVTIRGRGAFLCDPRAGHSPTSQATWAWHDQASRNPALQLLWYLLGWRINGKLAVGKGIPPERIDIDSFVTAANLCDEPVLKKDGTSEPRYQSDGVFNEGDDPSVVLDNLKATMNAVLDDVDGRIRLTVLHNDLGVPVGTLSEADVEGEFRWEQTPPLDQTFNVIRGAFTDGSDIALYQPNEYPEIRIPSPDGIDRIETVNYPLVQSSSQAQRLSKQRLQRMLYSGTFAATFLSTAWKFQKGDVIRFPFRPLGWDSSVLMRVVDTAVQVDGRVPMVLRVEHPAIYQWDATEEGDVDLVEPTRYDLSEDPIRRRLELLANAVDRGAYDPAVVYVAGNVVSLDDGSRWLFVDDTPTAGSYPTDANPLWSRLQGALVPVDENGTPLEDRIEEVAETVRLSLQNTAAVVAGGSLTPDRKAIIAQELEFARGRVADLIARAKPLGESTAGLEADFAAFEGYIVGLPNWSDPNATTPVDATIYNTLRTNLFATFATMEAAISATIAQGSRVADELVPGNSTIVIVGDRVRRTGTATGFQVVTSKHSTTGSTRLSARIAEDSALPLIIGTSLKPGATTLSMASILAGFRVYLDGQGVKRVSTIIGGVDMGEFSLGQAYTGAIPITIGYSEKDGKNTVLHQVGGIGTKFLLNTGPGQELVFKALLVGGGAIDKIVFESEEKKLYEDVEGGPPANATPGSNIAIGTQVVKATPTPDGWGYRFTEDAALYLVGSDGKPEPHDGSPFLNVTVQTRADTGVGSAFVIGLFYSAGGASLQAQIVDARKGGGPMQVPAGTVTRIIKQGTDFTSGAIEMTRAVVVPAQYRDIDPAKIVVNANDTGLDIGFNWVLPFHAHRDPVKPALDPDSGLGLFYPGDPDGTLSAQPVNTKYIVVGADFGTHSGRVVGYTDVALPGGGTEKRPVEGPTSGPLTGSLIFKLTLSGPAGTVTKQYPLFVNNTPGPVPNEVIPNPIVNGALSYDTVSARIENTLGGNPSDYVFTAVPSIILRNIETLADLDPTSDAQIKGSATIAPKIGEAPATPAQYLARGYTVNETFKASDAGLGPFLPVNAEVSLETKVTSAATVGQIAKSADNRMWSRTGYADSNSYTGWSVFFGDAAKPKTTDLTNQAGVPQSDATLVTAQGRANEATSVPGAGPFLFAQSFAAGAPTEAAKLSGIAAGATVGADFSANLLNKPFALQAPNLFESGYLKASGIYHTDGGRNLNLYFPEDINSNRTENRQANAALTVPNAGPFLFAPNFAAGAPAEASKLNGIQAAADVTRFNQIGMTEIAPIVLKVYSDTGALVPGQLPITRRPRLKVGVDDRSPLGEWSLMKSASTAATINDTPNDPDRGTITVTSAGASDVLTARADINGYIVERPGLVTIVTVPPFGSDIPTRVDQNNVPKVSPYYPVKVSDNGKLRVTVSYGYTAEYAGVNPSNYTPTVCRAIAYLSFADDGTPDQMLYGDPGSASYNYDFNANHQEQSGNASVDLFFANLTPGAIVYVACELQDVSGSMPGVVNYGGLNAFKETNR